MQKLWLLKFQIVICVHSFIAKQHMIGAAPAAAVDTAAAGAHGDIN
ncbi:hypothetical protein AXX16_0223 [Serratia rubidaea]|nr:hypothetical protein [Serratia rubidaea]AML55982.1 hypothetical protein AXX16_0223 [Serratia rubidaea]